MSQLDIGGQFCMYSYLSLPLKVSLYFPISECLCFLESACMCICLCVYTCTHLLSLSLCDFASYSNMHVVSPSAQLDFSQLPAVYTGVWLLGPAQSVSSNPHRPLWHASPPPVHAFCLSSLYPIRTEMPKAARQMVCSHDNGCAHREQSPKEESIVLSTVGTADFLYCKKFYPLLHLSPFPPFQFMSFQATFCFLLLHKFYFLLLIKKSVLPFKCFYLMNNFKLFNKKCIIKTKDMKFGDNISNIFKNELGADSLQMAFP